MPGRREQRKDVVAKVALREAQHEAAVVAQVAAMRARPCALWAARCRRRRSANATGLRDRTSRTTPVVSAGT